MASSKKSLGYTIKGIIDTEDGTITEITKDDEIVYDLNSILEEFNGMEVAISIAHKSDIEGE